MREDLRAQAHGRWPSILTALGVDPKFLRNVHGPCPRCGGGIDRYRFDDKGDGLYYCSKCGAGSGFDLIMGIRGVDFKGACELVRGVLPQSQIGHMKEPMSTEKLKKILRKLWEEAKSPPPAGQVERYLHGRGLSLPQGHQLREHAKCAYRPFGGHSGRDPVKHFPAMLAAVRNAAGEPVAIHRTYLQNGRKAPVKEQKKTLGRFGPDCAIRLYPAEKVMGVSEGIETGIAAHTLFSMPVWALMNAVQMERWVWPGVVEELHIFGDHDSSYAGQKASFGLAYRAHAHGLRVLVHLPHEIDTDWADELIRRGREAA